MPSQQLDLKYRPRKFAEVLGNKGVVKLLLKRSREGTLGGRSMMLGGPKGCGKTTLARLIAMAVACGSVADGEPCGTCDHCTSVRVGSSQEVEEFDAASSGSVEAARALVADADYESLTGGARVHIMDEAHGLSKQAQGALLKAVEDRTLVLILCTTEPHKILASIRSRVEEYPVVPPSSAEVVDWLYNIARSEDIRANPDALELIVRANECCPRSCVMSLDRASVLGPVTEQSVREILRYGSLEAVVRILDKLDSDPAGCMAELDVLTSGEGSVWVRDNLVAAISSAVRSSVGARPTFLVPTTFYDRRGRGWADIARALSSLDRPLSADVEAVLMSFSTVLPVFSPPASPVPLVAIPVAAAVPPIPAIQPTPPVPAREPEPKSKPQSGPKPEKPEKAKKPLKAVEVDGVHFSTMERLTTLDDKITLSQKREPPQVVPVAVEFGADHAPIPIRDFASGLIKRVRGE